MPPPPPTPLRLLVVCPSWLGDVVMATPAFRLLRSRLAGSFIGAMVRPGLDELLAGCDFFDEVHVASSQGLMGPKRSAAKVRGRAYDTALLLTNSFSTALVTRLAFIPRRIGYDRDGRGMLLTERLKPERIERGFAPVPMVEYYLRAARAAVDADQSTGTVDPARRGRSSELRLELAVTPGQDAAAERLLRSGGVTGLRPIAILNPGGNDEAKRWPADRFGRLGAHLASRGMDIAINGSPGERELVDEVARQTRRQIEEQGGQAQQSVVAALPSLGITIGSLKGVIRRAAIMVTNDTGPRHIAAAFGVPTVTFYGPTDPRWTTLPEDGTPRADVVADPDLPPTEVADDHREQCRIDRIDVRRGLEVLQGVLGRIEHRTFG